MKAYIEISPRQDTADTSPGLFGRLAIDFLRRTVPAANPDLEHLYERVRTWHVEIESSTGQPLREVGLDADGRAIVIGPWRENHGFIVDCNGTFDAIQHPNVSAEQFEHEWNSFNAPDLA